MVPPAWVLGVELQAEPHDEQPYSLGVRPALVNRKEDVAPVADGSYGVDVRQPFDTIGEVAHFARQPALLPSIRRPEHALVYVDDPLVFMQELDVLGRSKLPLKFGLGLIVCFGNLLEASIRDAHALSKIFPQSSFAYS